MHTVSLRKVGGSVMLAIPRALLDVLGITAGKTVGLSVQDGRLVVEPQTRPRYTLDELLAQGGDAGAPLTPDDEEWLSTSPVGREVI
jgi:antitoxin ChpS